jgi:hypothetical protein
MRETRDITESGWEMEDDGGCRHDETTRRMYGRRRDRGIVKVADSIILGIEPQTYVDLVHVKDGARDAIIDVERTSEGSAWSASRCNQM